MRAIYQGVSRLSCPCFNGKTSFIIIRWTFYGFGPIIGKDIFRILQEINRQGLTIFLIEQNVRQALKIAQHGFVLENGHVVLQGTGEDLLHSPEVVAACRWLDLHFGAENSASVKIR